LEEIRTKEKETEKNVDGLETEELQDGILRSMDEAKRDRIFFNMIVVFKE